MTNMISIDQANKLWGNLRDALVNTEKAIIEIIRNKAWEPLGYATFAEAWADRLDGVKLATDMARAHVLFTFFDEGMDDAAIRALIGPQVGDSVLKQARTLHKAGIPADKAMLVNRRPGTVVREHTRANASAPSTVHVKLTPAEYAHFKELADRHGMGLDEMAAGLLRDMFARLERKAA